MFGSTKYPFAFSYNFNKHIFKNLNPDDDKGLMIGKRYNISKYARTCPFGNVIFVKIFLKSCRKTCFHIYPRKKKNVFFLLFLLFL